jgi:hypothetical protein
MESHYYIFWHIKNRVCCFACFALMTLKSISFNENELDTLAGNVICNNKIHIYAQLGTLLIDGSARSGS